MPVHDWTRVDAGIFHAFHMGWTSALCDALNAKLLPEEYYALPEWPGVELGPIVVTDQESKRDENKPTQVAPPLAPTAEAETEFYRRKQASLVVRNISGDRVVAMIEIVSPANKPTRHALRRFVEKVADLLHHGVHLLILDLLPPGPRDPHGIHAAIWDEIAGREYVPPAGQPLTLAAYETDLAIRAFVRPIAVGDTLPEMPLFLRPNGCVEVPLEVTYQTAFTAMPRRWRVVLEAKD